jgi:hypothetical protein
MDPRPSCESMVHQSVDHPRSLQCDVWCPSMRQGEAVDRHTVLLVRAAFNEVSEVYYNVAVLLEHIQRFSLHFRVRIGAHRTLIDSVPAGFYSDFSMTELMRDVRLCGAFEPKDKIFALHGVFRRVGGCPASSGLQALAQRDLLYHNASIPEDHL